MTNDNSSKHTGNKPTTLAGIIRAAREAAGLSVRQLAPLVGVHHSVLARIETGDIARPSPELLQNIADALEIDASELLAFVGVKANLPEPKIYFRKAYGMSEREAEEAEALIAELRAKRRQPPESG
jgi:transcriptional regulator with XRE-family HTH domain